MIFIKLDHSLLLLFILVCHHSLTILKVFYLLHEDPMALLVLTNESRNKCEKIQLSNSFESILDEDVKYSIVFDYITTEETRNIFKVFAMLLYVFYIFNLEYLKKCNAFICFFLYIFNLEDLKKVQATFLLIQKLFFEFQISVKCYSKYK